MKTLIVLHGEPPTSKQLLEEAAQCTLRIAADGGIKAFLEAGVEPELHVGDFDSSEGGPAGECLSRPAQDATDFEKAIAVALDRGATELVVLGGMGGRVDHFLTNLFVGTQVPEEIGLSFLHGSACLIRVTPALCFERHLPDQTTLSLLPILPCVGVCTEGLKWKLERQAMAPNGQLGVSNCVVGDNVLVSLAAGVLYVYY